MNKLTCFSLGALLVLSAGLGAACNQPSAAGNNAATTASPAAKPATDPMPPATQNQEDAMPRVKAEEAKAEVAKGTAVVIDVRGTDSYKISHIKGALDYPLSRLEQGDFKDIPQGKRIIAYCTWPAEHTSARAALLLQKAGFKDAGALLGGMAAWEAAGGEMVKADPTPAPAAAPTAAPAQKPEAKPKKP